MSPGVATSSPQASRPTALDTSVLVLNRLYMAVQVIPARRAFCLLYKSMAEIVTLDDGHYLCFEFDDWCAASPVWYRHRRPDDDFVRAVGRPIAVPRIIRLLGYDRIPGQRVKFNRRNIFARDGHRCQYCGERFQSSHLSLDHVFPRSRGGPATWENIVSACVRCNVRKGGRTPQEANMALLSRPIKPATSPAIKQKVGQGKYRSWKTFLDHASWSVDFK
jgi:5-methylcytosine-specific restriction endonuclease McrA